MTNIKIYHRKKLLIPMLETLPEIFKEEDYELVASFTSDSSVQNWKPTPENIYGLSQNIFESWTKFLLNSDVPRRSTSIGDVIQIDETNHICDFIGFKILKNK